MSKTVEQINEKEEMNRLMTNLLSILKSMAKEHNRLSRQIITCLEKSRLVTVEQLTQDLEYLNNILRESQRLPIDLTTENPLHIFEFTTIKSSIYNGRLLVEIKIPIVEREIFSAIQIIPIPINVNNTSVVVITPSIQYVLMSTVKSDTYYIPISAVEYLLSKYNNAFEKIIRPATTLQSRIHNCEI